MGRQNPNTVLNPNETNPPSKKSRGVAVKTGFLISDRQGLHLAPTSHLIMHLGQMGVSHWLQQSHVRSLGQNEQTGASIEVSQVGLANLEADIRLPFQRVH